MAPNHYTTPIPMEPDNNLPAEVIERQPIVMNAAQMSIMLQRTPESAIKTRKGKGGKTFRYVTHAYVTRTLNEAFGWSWDFEVVNTKIMPENDPREVFVHGRLTVRTKSGAVVKEQFGSSEVKRTTAGDVISMGDDLKAASSDALKKCASLLGIALDLYES